MVKRCSWGTCNSDTRYTERIQNVSFVPFPKPKSKYDACVRWIKACGRPNDQLNINKITKDTYVCSKHFIDGLPSTKHPDPIPATGGQVYEARPVPKKRKIIQIMQTDVSASCDIETCDENNKETQTEEELYSALDFLALTSTSTHLEEENRKLKQEIEDLKEKLRKNEQSEQQKKQSPKKKYIIQKKHSPKKKQCQTVSSFCAEAVNNSKIPQLFRYYTGLTYVRFCMLVTFLFPNKDVIPVKYKEKRKEVQNMKIADQLFLVLCRLRNGLHIKDLAYRFSVKQQSVSLIFNSVIHYMYLKLGFLSYWPHRDVIIDKMPLKYKEEFPLCIAIIDCTEVKTEKPTSLKSQSQCYSDYKSTTTLKSLVVTDPRGSILFVSDLFSGSISDNEICKESGFYDLLKQLKGLGHIKEGDGIMADKGFKIEKELNDINLNLNIPPFASSASQMSSGDVALTRKIAAHRIHIERAINQIKNFKIVGRRVPGSLFHNINEIWTVCSILTNFQEKLVKV